MYGVNATIDSTKYLRTMIDWRTQITSSRSCQYYGNVELFYYIQSQDSNKSELNLNVFQLKKTIKIKVYREVHMKRIT